MAKQRARKLETVNRIEDIPDFPSEKDEHAFWTTHKFGEELLNAAQPLPRDILPPPRPRT